MPSRWNPTVGVEEEFLLVDPVTAWPRMDNDAVVAEAHRAGVELQRELGACQIETTSPVCTGPEELTTQLAQLRSAAAQAAARCGCRLLASAVPLVGPREHQVSDDDRYRSMERAFGILARQHGVCGCHIHVAVPDRDCAIAVGNRLRPWLPSLLALTANSRSTAGSIRLCELAFGHVATLAQRRRSPTVQGCARVRPRRRGDGRHRQHPRSWNGLLGRAAVRTVSDGGSAGERRSGDRRGVGAARGTRARARGDGAARRRSRLGRRGCTRPRARRRLLARRPRRAGRRGCGPRDGDRRPRLGPARADDRQCGRRPRPPGVASRRRRRAPASGSSGNGARRQLSAFRRRHSIFDVVETVADLTLQGC